MDIGRILDRALRGSPRRALTITFVVLAACVLIALQRRSARDEDRTGRGGLPESASALPERVAVANSMAERHGLVADPRVELVVAHCTRCHSARLIIQNRATREGWKSMIRWMQRTQNLGDFKR